MKQGGAPKAKAPKAAVSAPPTPAPPAPAVKDADAAIVTSIPPALEDGAPFSTKDVHPSFLAYCAAVAGGPDALVGVVARVDSLLAAIQAFVRAFEAPPNKVFAWSLDAALVAQLRAVSRVRPLTPAFTAAVRFIRSAVARSGACGSEAEARAAVVAAAAAYVAERVRVAPLVAAASATAGVAPSAGQTVAVFGRSAAVEAVLLAAHAAAIAAAVAGGAQPPLPGVLWHPAATVSVVVIDARPRLEGQRTARTLLAAGMPVTYCHLTSAAHVLLGDGGAPGGGRVDAVLLGAAAVFADGAVLGRAGTAAVARLARAGGIPVIAVAESFKLVDSASPDALGDGVNEAAAGDDVAHGGATTARRRRVPDALAAALRRAAAGAAGGGTPTAAAARGAGAPPPAAKSAAAAGGGGAGKSAPGGGKAAPAPPAVPWASTGVGADVALPGWGAAAGDGDGVAGDETGATPPGPLAAWRGMRGLRLLAPLYDVTPAALVTGGVLTEAGLVPAGGPGILAIARAFAAQEEESAADDGDDGDGGGDGGDGDRGGDGDDDGEAGGREGDGADEGRA